MTTPFMITTQGGVKYELQFAKIDFTTKTTTASQKNTIYKAHVHIDAETKEAKIGGDATEIIRAKVEKVVDDAAYNCGLKVIRCAHATDIKRPNPTKLYIDFDTDQARLDPFAPWKNLLKSSLPQSPITASESQGGELSSD